MDRFSASVMLSLLAVATGFSVQPACPKDAQLQHQRAARHAAPLCLGGLDATVSRRAGLAGVAGLVIGAGSPPALAGYVTSLGIETTKPEDADRDDDLLKSTAVQTSLKNLAACRSSASSLSKEFEANKDIALIPSIRKDFDFGKLRDDLNIASTVFDDQTQLTIDRLSRS